MTKTHRSESRRRLDVASLALLLLGLAFGILSYWSILAEDVNVLIIVPSVVAVTIGASHLIKHEAPRH